MLWQFKPAAGGGGGVTDHGALTGLADDDHPQYLTNARGDARYELLGGGGGAGITWNTVVLPVSTPVIGEAIVLHTDAAVLVTNSIVAMFVSSDHNELSDYHDDQMQVHAEALAGQVRFTILGKGLLVGPYTIKYGVS